MNLISIFLPSSIFKEKKFGLGFIPNISNLWESSHKWDKLIQQLSMVTIH